MSPKRATTILRDLRDTPTFAVYADGTRLRLGRARIYSFRREPNSWVEWGGVVVTRSGTVVAIDIGRTTVTVAPQDVHVDVTFSASIPLTDVLVGR